MLDFPIEQLKREAKKLARAGVMKHRSALDHLARKHGFAHWNGLLAAQEAVRRSEA